MDGYGTARKRQNDSCQKGKVKGDRDKIITLASRELKRTENLQKDKTTRSERRNLLERINHKLARESGDKLDIYA